MKERLLCSAGSNPPQPPFWFKRWRGGYNPPPCYLWPAAGWRPAEALICFTGYTLGTQRRSYASLPTFSALRSAHMFHWLHFGDPEALICFTGYTIGTQRRSYASLAT